MNFIIENCFLLIKFPLLSSFEQFYYKKMSVSDIIAICNKLRLAFLQSGRIALLFFKYKTYLELTKVFIDILIYDNKSPRASL